MEGKKSEIDPKENINKSEIYQEIDFKKEFEELLTKLNNNILDESDDITIIDLDFLKNDYIELYDLRKLLNDPKYYLAKFRINFLDFINLNDYFYKTFDNNELINEEKKETKGISNFVNKNNNENSGYKTKDYENKDKKNKGLKKLKRKNKINAEKSEENISVNINLNNTLESSIEQSKNNKKKESIEEKRKEKIFLSKQKKMAESIGEKPNDQINLSNQSKKEQLTEEDKDNQINISEQNKKKETIEEKTNSKINLSEQNKKHQSIEKKPNNKINVSEQIKNEKLIEEVQNNHVNLSDQNKKEELIEEDQNNQVNLSDQNKKEESIEEVQNNQINLSEQNKREESVEEDKKKSNSIDIDNNTSSFIESMNRSNLSKESQSSESSPVKYEITQNESALHLALTDMKKYIQKDKMSQFKFKFIKKELGIDENEKMSGTSYEEFCRKSFKIMLMMITQNNINFENPKNIKMSDLIELYLLNLNQYKNNQIEENDIKNLELKNKNKNLKLETNIHDVILTNLIDYDMEIDIVAEFGNDVIYNLIKTFPKNVIFYDGFTNDIEKENNNNTIFDKITLVAEIARNILVQGTEKLKQTIKYVEFISILNLYKDNVTKIINSEAFESLCKYCKMSTITEKVFCIITDGDYPILKFVFNEILNHIFQNNTKESDKVKEFIKNKITGNKGFQQRIEEKGIKLIEEKIYDNYLILENLKKNNITFFVLYIGDINQNFYEQNLICNILTNKKRNKEKELEKVLNSLKNKYKLKEIKLMNKKLKNIISSFNETINSISEKKFSEMNIEPIINTIVNTLKSSNNQKDFFDFKKLENEFKLDLVFNSLSKNNQSVNNKYLDLKENISFINSIKVITFQDPLSYSASLLKDLANSTEPTLFKIYIINDINIYNNIKSMISSAKIMKGEESYNVRYLILNFEDGKYKIDYEKSNLQQIFDISFLNINKPIIEEIKKFKKNINYLNSKNRKNEILTKENLLYRLKDEFSSLGIQLDTLSQIIMNYNYNPDEKQYQNLFLYFEEAFKLIEKDKKLIEEKIYILVEKINNLFENIICKRIYFFINYKIMKYINEEVYGNLKTKLFLLMNSLENIYN